MELALLALSLQEGGGWKESLSALAGEGERLFGDEIGR